MNFSVLPIAAKALIASLNLFQNGTVGYGADGFDFGYDSPATSSKGLYIAECMSGGGYNNMALFHVKNWNFWFDQMARSMNNNIRSVGTLPSPQYGSTMLNTIPVIHTPWPWFAYPLIILSASNVFLLLCIWQTSRRNMEPWKDNGLAVLRSTVDENIISTGMSTREFEEQLVVLRISDPVGTFVRP